MKRTRNGILIPDVPIMAGGNLPNAVKGVSAGGSELNPFDESTPFFIDVFSTLTIDIVDGLEISDDAKFWHPTNNQTLNRGRYYFRTNKGVQTPPSIISSETFGIGGNLNSLVKYDYESVDDEFHLWSFLRNSHVADASLLQMPKTRFRATPQGMFIGCTSLVNAPLLPATELIDSCYFEMFKGCTSLVNAPQLPATELKFDCYQGMFKGCTSLVNAPLLPATELKPVCYFEMFKGCTSLVNAPLLPATELIDRCYGYMFDGCTSLNNITCMATPNDANTNLWMNNVDTSGVFRKKRNTEWTRGTSGIPTGWTVEEID